jgi:hypothetical protein
MRFEVLRQDKVVGFDTDPLAIAVTLDMEKEVIHSIPIADKSLCVPKRHSHG